MSLIAYPNALKYKKLKADPWSAATIFAKADLESLADKFDTTETYTEGEIVLYQGGMFKCKAGGAGPGAWDATEWDQTTVEAELAALQTEIDSTRNTLNQLILKATSAVTPQTTQQTYTLTGLTADHELIRWNFKNGSTVVAENSPPVDLEWTTGTDQWTLVAGSSTAYTCQPVFAIPK